MATHSSIKKLIQLPHETSHGATIRLTVEYRIRPSVSPRQDQPYEEELQIDKSTIVRSPSPLAGSDDDKSTSSEEVVFEEWSEEFPCRRTDEYDQRTNELIRSTIKPTSAPIKGDVIKEEYKAKHQRAKRHRSADRYRSFETEEIRTSPPRYPSTTTLSSATYARPNEETYITEIVRDRNLARTIESDVSSSNQYDRLVVQVPKVSEREDLISEEYQVEIEQIDQGRDQNEIQSAKRDQQWRDELKERRKFIDDDEHREQFETSPAPPSVTGKRSSLIEQRRSTFENTSSTVIAPKPDRIPTTTTSVGELKNTFETPSPPHSPKDEYPTYSVPVVTGLTEQRRKLFEDQDGSTYQQRKPMLHEQRFPSIDALKSTFEPSISKTGRSMDITVQSKQTIASIDSDLSRTSPPKHQSTPKWKYQVADEGNESEDELSDPPRHMSPKTRFRDFSQSTPQSHPTIEKERADFYTPESGFYDQPTRSNTMTDETMTRKTFARPPPRHVSRKLINSPPNEYETLTNYRSTGHLPVVTQTRSPLVVDQVETIETETQVQYEVHRTNETSRRVLLNERPQYYESISSLDETPKIEPLHVTSLSPESQVTFGKSSSNEVIAIVRIPERPNPSDHSTVHTSSLAFPLRSPSHDPRTRPTPTRQSASLDNLATSNLDFHIQIEKRPPYQPEQPTVISLDQSTRAVVTTSKDGRVSIQNVAARPGNTVVIHSDFHSSDRSSGYFSSDDLRSYPLNTQDSSDDQSTLSRPRRFRNNPTTLSQLPSYYRPNKRSTEHVDQVNDLIQRHYQPPSTFGQQTGFNETIDQIDALYSNLDIREREFSNSTYSFSKPSSTYNRRRELVQDPAEYSKRYTSTGFQHIPSPPPTTLPLSDHETGAHHRHWSSSSLNDLVLPTSFARTSQSLSSSGILADYPTPGSISPTSAFGSTPDLLNAQSTRPMTTKKSQPRKYSDDDNDSPLSDNERAHFRSYYP